MTGPETELSWRMSRRARWAQGVVFLAFCGFVGAMLLDGRRPPGGFLLALVAMVAVGLFAAVRTAGMSLVATPEELVVRNQTRTYRLARADITAFDSERSSPLNPRHVFAELRDGSSVRMQVLEFQAPGGRREPLEASLDRLEAWRRGGARAG